jgi:hypothetical protein
VRSTSFLFAILFSIVSADAATITYATPAGSTYGGHPIDFDAIFTIDSTTNSITVVLDNYTSDPTADTQGISGISFTLSIADNDSLSLTNKTGSIITITKGSAPTSPGGSITAWEALAPTVGASTTTLTLNAFATSPPSDLIYGGPGTNGKYNNANNSITGHNPSIENSATFTLSFAGMSANTTVTSATFNVGTALSQGVTGTVQTPEPATWVMFLTAGVGLGISQRKRRA